MEIQFTKSACEGQRGRMIFGKEAKRKRWVEHFVDLLSRPPPTGQPDIIPTRNDLHINCEPLIKAESENAVKSLNKSREAGTDNIQAEALKSDIKATEDILRELFS